MIQKVCGIDVHKDLLVATILNPKTQQKQTITYKNSLQDIDQLTNWLKQNKCKTVAMESTNIYWKPLYLSLEAAKFQVILANAHQVKAIPGRKTDQRDSEWLAHLQSANLIKPSYVPPKHLRELRDLTRLRTKYVQARTQNKNRAHKILNSVNIRLHIVLSNIFGKAGTEIIEGLLAKKPIKTILENTKIKQLKIKSEEIESVVQGTLSVNEHFMLKQILKTIKDIDEQLAQIEQRIFELVDKKGMAIVLSVPGVGRLAGATILAELGEVSRFGNEKAVASFGGLAPCVYQSAGVTTLGHITKKGSKMLRWVMVETAHGAVRMDCRFKDMFLRIAAKKGTKVAYVAVARKLLAVIWHLLVMGEAYVEEGFSKTVVKMRSVVVAGSVSVVDMFETLSDVGSVVSKG